MSDPVRDDPASTLKGKSALLAPPDTSLPDPEDELAERARFWYLDAMNHPFWKKYREESEEDLGYYIGGKRAWSQEYSTAAYDKLKNENRAVVSFNHCQAPVELLCGYERQNRFDIKAVPQGSEDVEDAELLSWLLKFVQEQADVQEYLSAAFEDGVIMGLSCVGVEIDYSSDPFRGEIVVSKLNPGKDCLWDPVSEQYDFRDSLYFLRFKWAYVGDIIAEFPESAEAIRSAFVEVSSIHESKTAAAPRDAYGTVRRHPVEDVAREQYFYDAQERKALLLEAWYREPEDVWVVVNKDGGKPLDKDADGEPLSKETATRIAASDPDHLRAIKRRLRKVRVATIIPATFQVLEDGPTSYENDDENFPFVQYYVYRKGHECWGVIRNLKEPQRVENKKWSHALDLVARYANLRLAYVEGTLVNPRALEDPYDASPVAVKLEPGVQMPQFLVPAGLSEIVRLLEAISVEMKGLMREIPAINVEALGLKGDAKSGVAMAHRRQQMEIASTRYFDNLRWTRRLVGQRLARRIQQRFTMEEVLRLTNPTTGDAVDVRLNPLQARRLGSDEFREWREQESGDGRPRILKDLSTLKYDVVINEVPASPTARAQKAGALIELAKEFPGLQPILLPRIVELLDIPDRSRILQEIERMKAAQTQTAPVPAGVAGT